MLLAAAIVALAIPLALPSRSPPSRIAVSQPIELPNAVVVVPSFLEGSSAGAVIDLNAASAEELATLPSIGLALAERIVAYRVEYGPFMSIEDVTHVSGIGPATFAAFQDRVSVGSTDEQAAP